jgi:hypothetical protein
MGNRTKTRPAPAQNFNNRKKRRKFWVKKNWGEKIFGFKKNWSKEIFVQKIFWVKKMLGPKNILG